MHIYDRKHHHTSQNANSTQYARTINIHTHIYVYRLIQATGRKDKRVKQIRQK